MKDSGIHSRKISEISPPSEEQKRQRLESNYLRSILNYSTNVSLIFSDLNFTDPKIVEFSKGAEKLFGYTREEAIGMPVALLHSQDDIIHFPENFENMKAGKIGFEGDATLVRKDGTTFPALFSTYPVFDEKGELIAGLGISIDITERKNMEEELRRSNIAKDKIFSIIAHDLKSPFNSIIGFSNLLCDEDEEFDEDELNDIAQVINSTAKNAYELLTNLLEWSRSEAGSLKFKPHKFNLTELTRETVEMLESLADAKDIDLIFRSRKDFNVFADRNMVYTIIRNLITNAIKFTPSEGRVTLTISQNKEHVILSVADTGVGIEKQRIKTLLSQKLQESTKGTNKEKGSGLGLLLCKEFAAKNKGSIQIESELGQGSVFRMVLPLPPG